jgi:hypothetical protein
MRLSSCFGTGARVFLAVLLAAACLQGTGCGKKRGTVARTADDIDDDADTPEERRFIEAGKPFVRAVAQNRPEAAYAELSSHARRRMIRAQFGGGDPQQDRRQAEEFKDVTPEQFAALFAQVVQQFGTPYKVGSLSVTETDPKLLSGKVTNAEDRLAVMINIGAMPDSVPAAIRRAALRAQIQTRPAPNAGKAPRRKDADEDDEGPYFNVKYVLVEEDGKLKVGYFEFFPPSILD